MYTVLKDAAEGIAILADTDSGRALGPLIQVPDDAEQAARYMDAFVGALGVDPSTITPWLMEMRWQEYLTGLSELTAEDDTPATPTNEDAVPTGAPAEAPPEDDKPEEAVPAEPAPVAPGESAPAPETEPAPAEPNPEPVAPAPDPAGPPASAGETVACTRCDGFGDAVVNDAVVTCPDCAGSGRVPAPAAVAA